MYIHKKNGTKKETIRENEQGKQDWVRNILFSDENKLRLLLGVFFLAL